ncbi:hypothetical protein ACFOMD_15685 [Sphingoaurantiacus capsulatus]|uniref:O-antigen ligase family protein n=1 Tax=Sphingoaurantiacus capsulatus TaxID=1771310 RepID=A0ABV7XFG2_9SPHN
MADIGPRRSRATYSEIVVWQIPMLGLALSSAFIRESQGLSQLVALTLFFPVVFFGRGSSLSAPPGAKAFFCLSILMVSASYLEMLPNPWGHVRDENIVLRQAYPFLILPVAIYLFAIYINKLIDIRILHWSIPVLLMGLFAEYFFSTGIVRTYYHEAGVFYGLRNNISILGAICAYIYFERYNSMWMVFIIYLSANLLSLAMQNIILGVALFFILITNYHRSIFLYLVIFSTFGLILAYVFFKQAYYYDPNTAARAIWAIDGLTAWLTQGPFGFGFGVPALRGLVYSGDQSFEMTTGILSQDVSFFLIGHHNSFVGVIYRMGIFGIIFFYIMIRGTTPRSAKESEKIFSALSAILFLAMFLNVGIESPTYTLGCAFIIALATVIRHRRAVCGDRACAL